MGARGPKSAAELGTVTTLKQPPPKPDPSLTPDQAAIWKQVADSKPSGYFSADDLLLLSELCRAKDTANRIAKRIDASEMGFPDSFGKWISMRDKEVRRVATLATKLRLTPQSRYDKGVANTLNKRSGVNPPWDFDPDERFFQRPE